jgi:ribosomal protein L32
MMPSEKQSASQSFEGAINKMLDTYGLLSESVVCPNCNHISRSATVCTICNQQIPEQTENTDKPREIMKVEQ